MTAYPARQVVASATTREQLRAAVERVSKASLEPYAQVGTVLVYGPEGYQTSGLLREAMAALDEWKLIVGTADEKERDTDWSFIESLDQSLAHFGVQLPTPATDPGVADDPAVVGRRLADALAAIDRPVCVVVDQMHYADRKSAEAIRFGMRRHGDQHQMLLMSSESLTGDSEQWLMQLSVSRPAHNVVVQVPPLTAIDVQETAIELIGRPLAGRVARRFVADTEGNPALIAGLIDTFRDELERTPHPAGIDLERRGGVPLLPQQQHAFDTASPGARTAAEVVAVLREPTPMATVARVAAWLGITAAYGAFDLDEAVRLGLVRNVDGMVVPTVAPPTRVTGDRIAAGIPAERRREIHAAAADLLTGIAVLPHRIYAMREDDVTLVPDLMEAARSRVAASDAEKAITFALIAAQLAAPGEEYERALLFAGILGLRLHEHPRIFHLLGDFAALPESQLRNAILADLEVVTGRREAAIAHARAVVDGPADTADSRVVRAHSAVMIPLYEAIYDRHETVVPHVAAAREILAAEPADPAEVTPDLRWMNRPDEHELWLTAWELFAAARFRDSARLADRMNRLDQLLRTASDSAAVIDAVVYQSRTLAYAGRVADARNRLRRAIRIGASFPDAWFKYIAHTMHAHLLFLTGEWEKSLISGRIALEHALDDAYQPTLPTAIAVSALVNAARGEVEKVRRAERMLRMVPRTARGSVPYDPDLADIMRAELAAALGDPVAQLAATEAARSAARPSTVWSWVHLHIDALAQLGRVGEAVAVAEEAMSDASPWIRTPLAVSRIRARLAHAIGDEEQAVELYLRLVQSHTAAGQPFDLARDRLHYARALHATGDRQGALDQLELAAAAFRRLEAGTYLDRALALIVELRDDPMARLTRPRTADPLADLTPREHEVAIAVASGMTNREVAERLYVSVTTVNFHVRNILAKLALTSRRELRTIVHEHNTEPARVTSRDGRAGE